jgi:pimeloyl-ACP methyl ester carboxylesterase
MKVEVQSLTIYNSSGDKITADVHFVKEFLPAPVVIYSHGFLGFKDWGFIPYVADKFAEAGFVFVRFNFSHNGISENPKKITDFEKLAKNTISKQLEDLTAVIDYVSGEGFKVLSDGHLFLMGHSGGGGISIIKSVEDDRVGALCLWASISTFRRYSKHQVEEMEKNGYIFVKVPDSPIKVRMNKIIFDDFAKNKERYEIVDAFSKLKIPTLIIHGTADVIVPLIEAERLRDANQKFSKFVLIPEANHFFNTKHPFTNTSVQLEMAIKESVEFFKGVLKNFD